jgi:hypothetical protein
MRKGCSGLVPQVLSVQNYKRLHYPGTGVFFSDVRNLPT